MTQRLWVAGVLGGLVLVLGVVVLVFQFGIKNPSPPSLNDDPRAEIAGRIAYVDTDSCIALAEASGASRERLHCGFDQFGVTALTWLDEGTVAYATYQRDGLEWSAVDVATGAERSLDGGGGTAPGGPPEFVSPRGERLEIDFESGDVFIVEGAERIRIFDFDGPDGWSPELITWSPDGDWILLRYGREDELWIVHRTGEPAGTLVTDVSYAAVSWWMDGHGVLPEVSPPPQ